MNNNDYSGYYYGHSYYQPVMYQGYIPPGEYVAPYEKMAIKKHFSHTAFILMIHEFASSLLGDIMMGIFMLAGLTVYTENADGQAVMNTPLVICGYYSVILATILMCTVIFGRSDISLKGLFSTSGLTLRGIFVVIAASLGTANLVYCADIGVDALIGAAGYEISAFDVTDPLPGTAFVMDFIATVFLAPITEELFYRGIIMTRLCRVSKKFGIIVSAAIFGLAHGNLYQFMLGFAVGLIFAYGDVAMRSIIPSILAHIVINGHLYIYELIPDEELRWTVNLTVMIVLALAGAIIVLAMLIPKKVKIPESTEYHRKRAFPVMISSVPCWIMAVYYIFVILSDIQRIE